MFEKMEHIIFLTGNQLKIIALIAMTIDHLGVQIFTDSIILRIIGRLAMPIFAYMIAEGCRYTRNRKKYLGTVALIALLCQLVYFFAMGSLYQCIFVTFSLSIITVYALDNLKRYRNLTGAFVFIVTVAFAYFLTELLPNLLPGTDFRIDYGFFGVMLPVLISTFDKKYLKLLMTFVGVCLISAFYGGIQWYSLFAVLLLAFYNGKRGAMNLKYLFYVYYPLHLFVLYLIKIIAQKL